MSSQRKILTAIALVVVVVAIVAIYAWHNSHNSMANETPVLDTTTNVISATTPAEAVSNTTFDIVSPSTQPATSTVSGEAMPGSSGY